MAGAGDVPEVVGVGGREAVVLLVVVVVVDGAPLGGGPADFRRGEKYDLDMLRDRRLLLLLPRSLPLSVVRTGVLRRSSRVAAVGGGPRRVGELAFSEDRGPRPSPPRRGDWSRVLSRKELLRLYQYSKHLDPFLNPIALLLL